MAINILPYLRKSLYVLAILLVLVILGVLQKKHQEQICTYVKIEIEAPAEKQLITHEIIKNKLDKWYIGGLSGVPQKHISLADIEHRLEALPAIQKAEVSFDLNGEMLIFIKQRIPLVRMMTRGESYYLANGPVKIPSADVAVARVPIVNESLTPQMIKKVYTLSTYVYENPFIEAITEQIFVDKGDLTIISKIKNQKIVIGDTTDLPQKFEKLIDFYRDGLTHIGWEKYQTINLTYKNQIVCK